MKAERRHELKQNSLVRSLEGLPNRGKQYGSRAAMTLVVAAIIVLLVRYRSNTNAYALASARANLDEANRDLSFLSHLHQDPAYDRRGDIFFAVSSSDESKLAQERNGIFTSGLRAADDAIRAAPSGEAQIRAQALLAKANLNLAMADLPPIPGAATQPSWNVPPQDSLLSDAEANYNQVLQQYPDQLTEATAARFGIGAVAEDRAAFKPNDAADWDKARAQYQAIIEGNTAPQSVRELADTRLKFLEQLRKPLFLGMPAPATQPTSEPSATTLGPALPLSAAPATQPQVAPTSAPSAK